MTRILITHVQNTLNYGSAMMAINLIYQLRCMLGVNCQISCESDKYHLDRLKIGSQIDSLNFYTRPQISNNNIIKRIKKYLLGIDPEIISITKNFDMLIVLGGDDLSETYVSNIFFRGILYYHINRKIKVVLAGQSFGPFKGFYLLAAKIIFNKCIIITRDNNSYEFSKKVFKVGNLFKGQDLALLDLPGQEEIKNGLSSDLSKNYFVLVPSGLVKKYVKEEDKYIDFWIDIIEILNRLFPLYKIVLLAHVLSPERVSDRRVIELIYNSINGPLLNKVTKITGDLQPVQARNILGNSHCVITGRMHAAISSFNYGCPAISLAYSEKFFGVIGASLGLSNLIIDARQKNFFDKGIGATEIINKLDYIEKDYQQISKNIVQSIERSKSIVIDQIKYISELLRKDNTQ